MTLDVILKKIGDVLVAKKLMDAKNIFTNDIAIKLEEKDGNNVIYSIEVTPDKSMPPGKPEGSWLKSLQQQEYKRLVVRFNLGFQDKTTDPLPDLSLIKPAKDDFKSKGLYSFIYDEKLLKLSFKLQTDLAKFIKLAKDRYENFKKMMAIQDQLLQAKEKAASVLKDRISKRKQDHEARTVMFDAMVTALKGFQFRVESVLQGEYVNLTLKNDLKVRLQAEPRGVVVSDIEFNKEFDTKEVMKFVNELGKVNI